MVIRFVKWKSMSYKTMKTSFLLELDCSLSRETFKNSRIKCRFYISTIYRKVLNRVRTLLRILKFCRDSNQMRTVFESGLYLFLHTLWRFFKDENQQTWCPRLRNLPFWVVCGRPVLSALCNVMITLFWDIIRVRILFE